MTARAAVLDIVREAVPDLEDISSSNSLDTPEESFFAVIRWEQTDLPAFADRAVKNVQVWVHEKSQDYSRIDKALEDIRTAMLAAYHREGADGNILTSARWTGFSGDLVDDMQGTVCRHVDFAVATRPVPVDAVP